MEVLSGVSPWSSTFVALAVSLGRQAGWRAGWGTIAPAAHGVREQAAQSTHVLPMILLLIFDFERLVLEAFSCSTLPVLRVLPCCPGGAT